MSAPALTVDRLRFAVGGRGTGGAGRGARMPEHTILDVDTLEIAPGTVTGILGPNGAGKSTLLRLLASAVRPSGGSILIGADELASVPRRERAKRLALVEQEASAEVSMIVHDVVMLGRTPHRSLLAPDSALDDEIVDEALVAVGVADLAERGYDTLSGGERQRVQLARAFAQRTELLLLDEPTNHLDVRAQLGVLTILRERATTGLTAVAALHDLGLAASFCDALVLLHGGRVVATGAPAEVLTPELIARVYGVDAAVLVDPVTGRPVVSLRGVLEQ